MLYFRPLFLVLSIFQTSIGFPAGNREPSEEGGMTNTEEKEMIAQNPGVNGSDHIRIWAKDQMLTSRLEGTT